MAEDKAAMGFVEITRERGDFDYQTPTKHLTSQCPPPDRFHPSPPELDYPHPPLRPPCLLNL
jgi:hypothetical protein